MKHLPCLIGLLLTSLLLLSSAGAASASSFEFAESSSLASTLSTGTTTFAAAPRWWDDAVQWVRSLGWDRGRLVQIWLFFMLIGLYIILRIKPRA